MVPGVVVVVAAWMLDPAACAGMELGAPRVAVTGLIELHQLLTEGGFRRSSGDDPIVQEEQYEEPARAGSAICEPAPAQHPVRFGKSLWDDTRRASDCARPAGQSPIGGDRRRGRRV